MQSSSFLALFHCLNYLRFSSATEVRIPVCPLPSKIEQSCIKDSLPSSELSLQASDRNASTTIGKISQRRSQPRKNRLYPTPDAPPHPAQRICPPSRTVTFPHALGCSPCHVSISKHAMSALDPRHRHVSLRAFDR